MKKLSVLLLLLSCSVGTLFSLTNRIIDQKNSYGGNTIEYIYSKEDENYKLFSKIHKYLDSNNHVQELEIFFSPASVQADGIKSRKSFHKGRRNAYKYEIIYDKATTNMKGITKTVELVDENQQIVKKSYYKGNKLVLEDFNTVVQEESSFPLLKMSYVAKHFIEHNKGDMPFDKESAEFYTHDLLIRRARSIVTFANKIEKLNAQDLQTVKYMALWSENDRVYEIYKHKVLVEENGKQYWVLFQERLLKHLKKDAKILLTYDLLGRNGKACFIGNGFREEIAFFYKN